MVDWLLAAAIGFVSGVLSGAFGIGGGIITTPAIRLVMGAPALIAVGTPLPVIIPSAITGALSYGRRGLVDMRSGVAIGLAGAATAVFGALLATRAGGTAVLLGTALLIFYAATDMVLQVIRPPKPTPPTAEEAEAVLALEGREPASGASEGSSAAVRPPAMVVLLGMGALTGLYSGFFGLGGGFVLVPMLTRWLRFPIKRAIATSLVAVALLAVPGTITHAILGNIDWRIALGLAIGVVPGALVGARITLGAAERAVRIAFAVLLVVVGAWLFTSELWRLVR